MPKQKSKSSSHSYRRRKKKRLYSICHPRTHSNTSPPTNTARISISRGTHPLVISGLTPERRGAGLVRHGRGRSRGRQAHGADGIERVEGHLAPVGGRLVVVDGGQTGRPGGVDGGFLVAGDGDGRWPALAVGQAVEVRSEDDHGRSDDELRGSQREGLRNKK